MMLSFGAAASPMSFGEVYTAIQQGVIDGAEKDVYKRQGELKSYGGQDMKPEGEVIEIIGHINDPGTDILSIVKEYDLPVSFPEKVLNQAVRVGKRCV